MWMNCSLQQKKKRQENLTRLACKKVIKLLKWAQERVANDYREAASSLFGHESTISTRYRIQSEPFKQYHIRIEIQNTGMFTSNILNHSRGRGYVVNLDIAKNYE